MAAMADLMAIAALVMVDPMVDMEAAMADLMEAIEAMVMAADPMVDMEATMARGRLKPPLMLSPVMDMVAMADLMEAIEAMVMAADPMEDMDMEVMAMASKP